MNARADAIYDGKEILVAITLDIAKGYHIYAQNPGDTGIPTTVNWSTSTGAILEPLLWPTPHVVDADGLISYCFEDRLRLFYRLHSASKSPTITAKVSWLVCKESCTPGSTSLKVDLSKPQPKAEFTKELDAIPKSFPTGVAKVIKSGGAYTIQISKPNGQYSFLSTEPNVVANTAPVQGYPEGDKTVIRLEKNAFANSQPTRFRGILIQKLNNKRTDWAIDLPIVSDS